MAGSEYSLQIEGSIDVPDRTAYIDDEDFTDQAITLTGVARASPGDTLDVSSAAPSGTDYQLELLDNKMNTVDFSGTLTGNATYTFDTSGFEPGTYGVVSTKNGEVQAMFPVVLRSYTVEITSGPSSLESGDELTVQAELSQTGSESLYDVRLILMSKEGDTGGEKEMTDTGSNVYAGTIPDIVENEYVYGVAVRGNDEVQLSVEETFFINDNAKEAIGHSNVRDLSVSLSDADKLAQKWTADKGGRFQFSTPTLNNDFAFIGGLDETTEARWRNTGSQKWEFGRSGSLSDSSPLLDSGTVYIGAGGGEFYALDATSGAEQWVADVGSAVTSTPALMNGTVYFGSNDGQVHAVDVSGASGSETPKWSVSVGEAIYSDLAVGDGRIFVTTNDGDIVALNSNGSEDWRINEGTEFQGSSPQFADGWLYVAGQSVYKLDPASGTAGWEQSNYSGTEGSDPILDQGVVFVGASDGRLHALNDTDGGAELWTAQTGEAIATNPVVVDDRVVTASLDGTISVFDRTTGNEVWTESLGSQIRSSPVVRDDEVYFGTEGGTFYVLENVP